MAYASSNNSSTAQVRGTPYPSSPEHSKLEEEVGFDHLKIIEILVTLVDFMNCLGRVFCVAGRPSNKLELGS